MESLESFYIEVLRSILDHHEDWIAVSNPKKLSACMRRYGPVGGDSYKLDIETVETEEFFGTMSACMNRLGWYLHLNQEK